MATINQHAQSNPLRAAKVKQAVHGGPDRAACVEHVVDKDKVHAVHAKFDVGRLQDRLGGDLGKVVAVKRDVQNADRHVDAVNSAHGLRNPLRQGHTTAPNPNERQVFCAAALFDNFVGDAL